MASQEKPCSWLNLEIWLWTSSRPKTWAPLGDPSLLRTHTCARTPTLGYSLGLLGIWPVSTSHQCPLKYIEYILYFQESIETNAWSKLCLKKKTLLNNSLCFSCVIAVHCLLLTCPHCGTTGAAWSSTQLPGERLRAAWLARFSTWGSGCSSGDDEHLIAFNFIFEVNFSGFLPCLRSKFPRKTNNKKPL